MTTRVERRGGGHALGRAAEHKVAALPDVLGEVDAGVEARLLVELAGHHGPPRQGVVDTTAPAAPLAVGLDSLPACGDDLGGEARVQSDARWHEGRPSRGWPCCRRCRSSRPTPSSSGGRRVATYSSRSRLLVSPHTGATSAGSAHTSPPKTYSALSSSTWLTTGLASASNRAPASGLWPDTCQNSSANLGQQSSQSARRRAVRGMQQEGHRVLLRCTELICRLANSLDQQLPRLRPAHPVSVGSYERVKAAIAV